MKLSDSKNQEQGGPRALWPSPQGTRGTLLTFLYTWQRYHNSILLPGVLIN